MKPVNASAWEKGKSNGNASDKQTNKQPFGISLAPPQQGSADTLRICTR